MNHPTLLCHMDVNSENKAVLAVTADLAAITGAAVIGVAACQPMPPLSATPITPELIEADMADVVRVTRQAEQRFRAFIGDKVRQQSFRSAITHQELADYIARQARAADHIITGPDMGTGLLASARHANIGDLVMHAGRPVIIVPKDAAECLLGSMVVAWKDSREARRAVADALPLLRHGRRVTVLEVARKGDHENAVHRTVDVAAWLGRHGILAQPLVRTAEGRDVDCLREALDELACDFLIAGAYSHSRIGEWAFGGVTTDLLLKPRCVTLVSH